MLTFNFQLSKIIDLWLIIGTNSCCDLIEVNLVIRVIIGQSNLNIQYLRFFEWTNCDIHFFPLKSLSNFSHWNGTTKQRFQNISKDSRPPCAGGWWLTTNQFHLTKWRASWGLTHCWADDSYKIWNSCMEFLLGEVNCPGLLMLLEFRISCRTRFLFRYLARTVSLMRFLRLIACFLRRFFSHKMPDGCPSTSDLNNNGGTKCGSGACHNTAHNTTPPRRVQVQ